MPQPLVLLGLGGIAASAEFALAQIAAAHPVVLADVFAPAWARPHLARHLRVDPADETAVSTAVRALRGAHDLGGVLTYTSEHLVTASRVARQLELPGPATEAMAACTDRTELRARLARHRVPLPFWAGAHDAETAAAHADAIGYPAVIRARTGRVAVGQAGDRSEVADVCARVGSHSGPRHPGLLVERHLDGPQIAAEAVVLGSGDVQIVAITRTCLGPPPARQAVRHSVYAHDSLLHNRLIRQTVARAVEALGITLGVLHIEMTLTCRGPHVTEVTAHLADDLIPLLVKRATGLNLPQIAADLAVGRVPKLVPTRQRAAAVHFAYPTVSGLLQHVSVATPDCHPLVDRTALTCQPGTRVAAAAQATAVDRLAYWVALGATAADCHTHLDQVSRDLEVDIAPLAAAHAA
ncbi:ATP-grasp domain-containing protein [Streptomyces sp. bgisy159]|uniref:ATP-binding protein n=1 Tax=Streptomyces sp. bgisy159 TaxID=3413795 RepID=UPI003F4A2C8D